MIGHWYTLLLVQEAPVVVVPPPQEESVGGYHQLVAKQHRDRLLRAAQQDNEILEVVSILFAIGVFK